MTVPQEAASPGETMELADLRMYAQKESRQVSRDSGIPPVVQPGSAPDPVEA